MVCDMRKFILEACVDSVPSALAAVEGGADRLELCGNLIIGGTTPDLALYKEIRKYTDIPARALLRPRFGDFCYDEYEYHILLENIAMYKDAGIDGIVIGSLLPDGSLNVKQMEGMIRAAGTMGITLHRAFDMCSDAMETLHIAKEIGVDTILTSGQQGSCSQGGELLKDLVEAAGEEMTILVGAGVNASVIKEMHEKAGATAFHMSGKVTKNSKMEFRRDTVNMGLPGISEYEIWQTSEEHIKNAKDVLEHIKEKFRY